VDEERHLIAQLLKKLDPRLLPVALQGIRKIVAEQSRSAGADPSKSATGSGWPLTQDGGGGNKHGARAQVRALAM
jgi:hypothetical protein